MPNLTPGETSHGPTSSPTTPDYPTAQQLLQPLLVHFRRFVGEQIAPQQERSPAQANAEPEQPTVWNRLSTTPDFLLESGQVNPAWVATVRPIHNRITHTPEGKRDTPGKLTFSKTAGWQAADPNSPIGHIAKLQQQAREAQAQGITPATIKATERTIRKELVDIFNDYAGKRFNGTREVVNTSDFRGVSLHYVAYRSLRVWRDKLIRTRYQAVIPELFDRWESAPKGLKTPSRADQFLMAQYKEIRQTQEPSSNANLFSKLMTLPDAKGYIVIADAFYTGDMEKTYKNLSAVAKTTGQTLPKDWQKFHGSTTEFRQLQLRISTFTGGIDGFLSAADELYEGDMHKTYKNLSAIAKMTGQTLPNGWQTFQGSTTEFRQLQFRISTFTGGLDGYVNAADELYRGDMQKTYQNLSAVAKMTGQTLPEGWQQFHGSTTEFRTLQNRIPTFTGGIDGYHNAADELYDGDMQKTYINLSAVAKMTRQELPNGWQSFQGSTTEFRVLQNRISAFTGGIEGYLSAADELYRGAMQKTYQNLSAVAKMTGQTFPEGWQQFHGSTTEFIKHQQWLRNNPQATIDMFMVHIGTKSRDKAQINLAAIRNMTI